MSDKTIARRADATISFNGINITNDIRPYLKSLTFIDNESDETDDLQIELQDREGKWLSSWLGKMVNKSSMTLSASIKRINWNGDGKDTVLKCGKFELDAVKSSGGSGEATAATIKATSLSFKLSARQTKKSRAWEKQYLKNIVKTLAKKHKMKYKYLSSFNPYYKRIEQSKISDIEFLSKLCKNAGISLKVTNNTIVLFDQEEYEAKHPVFTIKRNSGTYSRFSLDSSDAGANYDSCRVRYTTPKGKLIQGVATASGYNSKSKSNQQLEIRQKVSSASEAKRLAAKQLRLHNKFECTATFTLEGNTALVAGVTVSLSGFGMWDGKYIISQSKHSIGTSGYVTTVKLRRVLHSTGGSI